MNTGGLYWLPKVHNWAESLLLNYNSPGDAWPTLVALAKHDLDFIQNERVSSLISKLFPDPPSSIGTRAIRLALIGSATMKHLHASIRVAALRRGIWTSLYENEYGQYRQELMDVNSGLHRFKPDAILLALDPYHVMPASRESLRANSTDELAHAAVQEIAEYWRAAATAFNCIVLQQAILPVHSPILGNNEHRLVGSAFQFVIELNRKLRVTADQAGADIISIDTFASALGIRHWHDPGLWHRTKQEVTATAAPLYGELVGRVLAAKQGRSAKCLVMDLDNTLWGGAIGDLGLEGITLGQGSAQGEAFLGLQQYALDLSKRGVILAVCSKNDEQNALEAFEKHPDMLLRKSDIACFVANWSDKAENIRVIAKTLNIGLDSVVFLDDSPFERELVRRALPPVNVPEIPEQIELVPRCLSDAGYFESTIVTQDDLGRNEQYKNNIVRRRFAAESTDLRSYLKSLQMKLVVGSLDGVNLSRTSQLINKTNQFNLTSKRYSEREIEELMKDPMVSGLSFRLIDRFGDNGVIAVVINRQLDETSVEIDTWLMSCRVLGRQVEHSILSVIVGRARTLGISQFIGIYRRTEKNGMVENHYERLGFRRIDFDSPEFHRSLLTLNDFADAESFIEIVE